MKDKIRQQLLEINRIFYEKNAKEFSGTRNYYWKGWKEAWEVVKTHNPNITNILDVGCGNGRFLSFLRENADHFNYLGIDLSSNFISECQEKLADDTAFFMRFDVMNDDFSKIANEKYDLISVIAILHHIPGSSNRQDFISHLTALLKPNGIIILTFWDFLQGNRMQDRIFPWSLTTIDKKDLEEGDFLLKWSDSEDTQRYCHYFSEQEKLEIIKASKLKLLSRFTSDASNTYAILQKP